jgi:FkbM family methyltransferase
VAFFRLRWLASRVGDPEFRRILRRQVANSGDYWRAAMALPRRRPARKPRVLLLRNGDTVKLRSFIAASLFAEIFVDEVYDIELGPVRSVIDVGADVGLFTLWASQKWPGARILAYEPEPQNFALLRETIADNEIASALPIRMAIAAEPGSVDLDLQPQDIGGHGIRRHSRRLVRVAAHSLADAVAAAGGECDLLKLDRAAAEGGILQGMTPSLAKRIKAILFAPEASLFPSQEFREYLHALGFRTFYGKGIVAARRTGD